jgi:hypothetical protein
MAFCRTTLQVGKTKKVALVLFRTTLFMCVVVVRNYWNASHCLNHNEKKKESGGDASCMRYGIHQLIVTSDHL